jgi:hypothetical protein
MEPGDIARVYIYEAGGVLRTSTPPSLNRRLLLCTYACAFTLNKVGDLLYGF